MQTPCSMGLLKVLNAVLIRKLIGKLMAQAKRERDRYNIYRSTSRHAPSLSRKSLGLLINRDLIKPNRKETRDTDVRECLEQIYCFLQPHNKWAWAWAWECMWAGLRPVLSACEKLGSLGVL